MKQKGNTKTDCTYTQNEDTIRQKQKLELMTKRWMPGENTDCKCRRCFITIVERIERA